MPSISEKLFGSEENASELQRLDESLHTAIEDLKKLKKDWKLKCKKVKSFVKKRDNTLNFRVLRNSIRAVEELERDEEQLVSDAKQNVEVALHIRSVLTELVSRSGYSPLVGNLNNKLVRASQLKSPERRISRLFSGLSKSARLWKELEEVLGKQIEFINKYEGKDKQMVFFNVHEFIGYLKEESRLISVEDSVLHDIDESEEIVKKEFGFVDSISRRRSKINQLQRWGFPVSELGQSYSLYLLSHWESTVKVAKHATNAELYVLFHDILPILLQHNYSIADIAHIAEATDMGDYLSVLHYLGNHTKVVARHGCLQTGIGLAKIMRNLKHKGIEYYFQKYSGYYLANEQLIAIYGALFFAAIIEEIKTKEMEIFLLKGVPACSNIISPQNYQPFIQVLRRLFRRVKISRGYSFELLFKARQYIHGILYLDKIIALLTIAANNHQFHHPIFVGAISKRCTAAVLEKATQQLESLGKNEDYDPLELPIRLRGHHLENIWKTYNWSSNRGKSNLSYIESHKYEYSPHDYKTAKIFDMMAFKKNVPFVIVYGIEDSVCSADCQKLKEVGKIKCESRELIKQDNEELLKYGYKIGDAGKSQELMARIIANHKRRYPEAD